MRAIVKGMAELNPKLDALETKVRNKVLRTSLRAGAKITYIGALGTVPVQSGATRAALKVRSGARTRKHTITMTVGIGDRWFVGDQFYAAFVEFGHRQGPRRLGDKRKKIPGEHALKYAYEETREAALSTVVQTLETELNAAVREVAGGVK